MTIQPRLLVMAGGTGGHVFPGLAVAEQLKQDGWDIHWLGTADRMEADIVPRYGVPIHFIQIQGLRGNGAKRLLAAPFSILRAIWQAMKIIRELKPDVVIGFGGYASGPGGIAAKLMGKPLVLHEQNAVAGMTNRYLAKIANRVLTAFPNTLMKNSPQVVGNPVRNAICAIAEKQDVIGPLNVLVVGGSLGAQILNETVPLAINQMDSTKIAVWHQTGKNRQAEVEQRYAESGAEIRVTEFIDDMATAYSWADVVICRAGALTVSELAAAGKPGILVPFPHAVDDHQTWNARYLSDRGAGLLVAQGDLSADQLAAELTKLSEQPQQLQMMASNAKGAAQSDSAERVAGVCIELRDKQD